MSGTWQASNARRCLNIIGKAVARELSDQCFLDSGHGAGIITNVTFVGWHGDGQVYVSCPREN